VPVVPAVVNAESPLIALYQNAWAHVVAQQQVLIDNPLQAVKAARLREMRHSIEATMRSLDPHVEPWLTQQLPAVLAEGGRVGAAEAAGSYVWSQISQDAVEQLAGDFHTHLLEATQYVEQSTKDLIRTLGRDAALQTVLEGGTAQQAATEMRRILNSDGIAAVVYSNGARHGLAEYAEMQVRTTTATAYNVGFFHGASQSGVTWYECFDGPDCGWSFHEDPELANGKIVNMDEGLAFPISHPNCRRTFGARPDLTERPADGRAPSTTPEQEAAQRAQDAERVAKQERAALRRSNTAASRADRAPASRLEKRAAKIEKRQGQRLVVEGAKSKVWSSAPDEAFREKYNYLHDLHAEARYSAAQQEVLDRYQGTLYQDLNGWLRAGGEEIGPDPRLINASSMMDSTMRPLPERLTAFRGADLDAGQFHPGAIITDEGYVSTTLNEGFATDWISGTENPVLFEIDAPAGTPAALPEVSTSEQELVLSRGSRFEVLRVESNTIKTTSPFGKDRVITRVVVRAIV
jgi:hypothetical protein